MENSQEYYINILKKAKINEYKENLNNYNTVAKLLDVYDGDTITTAILLPNNVIKEYKCRIYGYDSPEMKPSKNIEDEIRKDMKQSAIRAKKLVALLLNHSIPKDIIDSFDNGGKKLSEFLSENLSYFHTKLLGPDKYGRMLIQPAIDVSKEQLQEIFDYLDIKKNIDFYTGSATLDVVMVGGGCGYPYFGGTKEVQIPLASL